MLFLNKDDIAKSIDLNGMMDQIEEAYRIFGSGEFYMPEGKHEIKFELVGNAYSLQWMKLINIDVETDPMFDECFTE